MFQHDKEHWYWSAYLGNTEASVLYKHGTEYQQQMPADRKIKVYNYHTKQLKHKIEEGVLINNARGGELLNFKSEMTRVGKIPRLVIMVGDKEVHNSISEHKQVEPDTPESSPEVVPTSVGRSSKKIHTVGKRLVHKLISDDDDLKSCKEEER